MFSKKTSKASDGIQTISSAAPISYVSLEPTAGNPNNASKYIQYDAAPGLDQSIAPHWSSAHTFLSDVRLAPPGSPNDPNASLKLDSASLRYTVTQQGGMHEFYVGSRLAAQVQDLSSVALADIPDSALANWAIVKQYLASQVTGSGPLNMLVSYGAPAVDPDELPGFDPANSVTIYGPTGMRYIVLANPATTLWDGAQSYNGYCIFTMGSEQVKRLSVQLPPGTNNLGVSIRCAVHSPTNDNTMQGSALAKLESMPPIEKSADFYPVIGVDPQLNFQLIESYGYTRGVPSDGQTPAQIYVIVDASQSNTSLKMDVVEGDATFDVDGKLTHAEPAINKPAGKRDGWVLVNVYSKSATVSKVKIYAAGVDDVVYAYPSFLPPPVA